MANTIKFKRIPGVTSSFNDAVQAINDAISTGKLSLGPGEPLVCSYKYETETKAKADSFFLAIGTICANVPTIKVFPAFNNLGDFETFIKSKCGESASFDLEAAVDGSSDIAVEKNGDKFILKIKDNVLSCKWESL